LLLRKSLVISFIRVLDVIKASIIQFYKLDSKITHGNVKNKKKNDNY
jgi:hypothetical protein